MQVISNFYTNTNNILTLENQAVYTDGVQMTGYLRGYFKGLESLDIVLSIVEFMKNKIGHFDSYDCYFLKYPKDTFIPLHKDDKVFNSKHYRFNLLLKQPKDSGLLFVDNKKYVLNSGDGYFFRPDVQEHEVTKVNSERIILTVGTLI